MYMYVFSKFSILKSYIKAVFFVTCVQDIDWSDILAKKVAPPFQPYITDDLDVGNFSDEFTALTPVDSPAQPPTKHADIFRVTILLVILLVVCQ